MHCWKKVSVSNNSLLITLKSKASEYIYIPNALTFCQGAGSPMVIKHLLHVTELISFAQTKLCISLTHRNLWFDLLILISHFSKSYDLLITLTLWQENQQG